MENKLTANFSVSNTDVITMLVVKNREILQKQREDIVVKYQTIVTKQVEAAVDKWNKFIEKKKNHLEIIDAYTHLLNLLNPKAKFTVEPTGDIKQMISGRVYEYYRGRGYYTKPNELGECIIQIDNLDYSPKFEETEEGDKYQDNFHCVSSGDGRNDGINISIKFKYTFKISEEALNHVKKMEEIDGLLRNESVLKEKLIARVTENAIKTMPELSGLVEGIELLAIES